MFGTWKIGLAIAIAMGIGPVAASAQTVAAGATPPMGWNSWDAYGLTITEPQFRANVSVLKSKLLPFGWNYAVIDEGWFFENPQDRDTPDKLHYAIDPTGRYVPVPARFPSAVTMAGNGEQPVMPGKLAATIEATSFVELSKWVHAQGLKFGIHIVRGIPRASVERNLPVEGSSFRAQDVADQTDACPWDPTNWGVKDNAAGQAWYDSLLRQYAAWGVDLLKVDCIADHPYKVDEIRMIRRAIDKTGRPMVLSLSPGPTGLEHAAEVGSLAQMWRISNDIWDTWSGKPGQEFPQPVKEQFERTAAWAKYAKPGNWPDADMLPLGELRPAAGWGPARTTRLTPAEQKTLVTLWSMARSPLIVGANLTMLDEPTLKLLTNRDVIAIDQTAVKSEEVLRKDGLVIWKSHLPNGRVAMALFNIGDTAMLTDAALGAVPVEKADGKKLLLVDVWTGQTLGKLSEIPAHGCVLLKSW